MHGNASSFLDSAQQEQNQDDDQDGPDHAAGCITPTAACGQAGMTPTRIRKRTTSKMIPSDMVILPFAKLR